MKNFELFLYLYLKNIKQLLNKKHSQIKHYNKDKIIINYNKNILEEKMIIFIIFNK